MMKNVVTAKEIKMLELLAQGASSKELAKALGYSEGTMRVYLHLMYRKIGVRTKTTAVTWYLARTNRNLDQTSGSEPVRPVVQEEQFGDFAVRTSLFAALGVMSMFFGAYGRMWDVANRLKGGGTEEGVAARQRISRQIWEAALAGDFAFAKRFYDNGHVPKLFVDSPSDAVLLACMLLLGGYTHAGQRTMSVLVRRERGRIGISANEHKLLQALRDVTTAARGRNAEALNCLYQLAREGNSQQVLKHTVMVLLYYIYLAERDTAKTVATANAIWSEAQSIRQHLQAMGEKPLDVDAALPAPPAVSAAQMREYLDKLAHA
jgi:DNA-binding CsgD family transcriptional regulator